MKNYTTKVIVILGILITTCSYGQRPNAERIKSLRVAFLTERLALKPNEAQQFWPVYNTYDDALQKLRQQERRYFGKHLPRLDDLSKKEATQLLVEFHNIKEEKHNLQQQFITELKNVLPIKKIILLLKAEEDFKKRLLHQVRKRRGER